MNRNIRQILHFLIAPLGLAIVLSLTVEPSWAANAHYVRSGATGNGSGSDWTNACIDFTGSCAVANLVRGDTYYVATGAYATRNFTTVESGTSVITIKGATAADHGTETGWSPAFGVDVTQATFAYGSTWAVWIGSSYWVFDGSVGSGNVAASYGFRILPPTDCNTASQSLLVTGKVNATLTQTGLTIKHLALVSCGSAFDQGQFGMGVGCGACYTTNSVFANILFDGGSKAMSITNLANSTIEYNWSQNQWSSSAHHGGVITNTNCHNNDFAGCSTAFPQGQGNFNNTIRYNIIKGCRGTACIEALDPGYVVGINAYKIYGNVFVDDQSGNGTIATGTMSSIAIANTEVYNNTFINCVGVIFRECGASGPCAFATGNTFKNNLLYNSSSLLSTGTGGGAYNADYNTYWTPKDAGRTEAHGQIVLGGACPMGNCAIGNTGNYHLLLNSGTGAGQVNVGLMLAAPFNMDMEGHTRGADGTWERGALEFTASPNAPTNLAVRP